MISRDTLIAIEEAAINRYSSRYKDLGVSPRALGWGSKEDQLERFKVIVAESKLDGKTIIDVGCGFGDLFVYLTKNNIEVDYIGIDIIPEFIDYCRNQFPDQKFYCVNIMTSINNLPKADIVISLGALNYKLSRIDNFEYTKLFIQRAFNISKEMLIVDFLSEYRIPDYPKEDFVYYHKPEDILSLSMSLTNNVKLIHNYKAIPQKEFMIMLER